MLFRLVFGFLQKKHRLGYHVLLFIEATFLPYRNTRSRKGKLILFAEHCLLGGSYVRMLCDRILAGSGVNFALVDMPKGVEALDKYEHFACCTGQTHMD